MQQLNHIFKGIVILKRMQLESSYLIFKAFDNDNTALYR